MYADFLLSIFKKNKPKSAIVWKGEKYTYQSLLNKIEEANLLLEKNNISNGSVVALEGDFSPNTISLFLSLINLSCIIIPLTKMPAKSQKKLLNIAKPEFLVSLDKQDNIAITKINESPNENHYETIRAKDHPGLVLFTSGTSGEPKAAVHDFRLLLKKFETQRSALSTINFLLFDHWGGLNTMLHILSNAGELVATKERSPDNICKLIEDHKVELLPASPTFLNLLLLSDAYKNCDLSSLKIISYGTEPMPETTLKKLKITFPKVKLLQTYGLIELGVLRSKSENNDSLWVQVGGDGYQTRIIDGILQIKAESAMLGYLNAPSPFTDDGWFNTGDEVLERGGFIKILGRKSEIINVGGEKVYPQEVENTILQIENVADVTVFGEANSLIGNIVCANITLKRNEDQKVFIKKMKTYCREQMQDYKIPVRINIIDDNHHNLRFKKQRVK